VNILLACANLKRIRSDRNPLMTITHYILVLNACHVNQWARHLTNWGEALDRVDVIRFGVSLSGTLGREDGSLSPSGIVTTVCCVSFGFHVQRAKTSVTHWYDKEVILTRKFENPSSKARKFLEISKAVWACVGLAICLPLQIF